MECAGGAPVSIRFNCAGRCSRTRSWRRGRTCSKRPGLATTRDSAWAVLPGDGVRPAPSLELQAELDEEIAPVTCWAAWRVDVAEVANPLAMLRALGQLAHATPRNDAAQGIRIGDDLRFWSRLAASFERAIRHHEYLPAIFAAQSGAPRTQPARGKRRKTAGKNVVRFEAGWEFAATAEENIVEPFARAMPGACRALWAAAPQQNGARPEQAAQPEAAAQPELHGAARAPASLPGSAAAPVGRRYAVYAVGAEERPGVVSGARPAAGCACSPVRTGSPGFHR